MASALSTPSNLPTRRRRDSSEDFGEHSLGSIAGSEVGSSIAGSSGVPLENPKAKVVEASHPKTVVATAPATPGAPPATAVAIATSETPGPTSEISTAVGPTPEKTTKGLSKPETEDEAGNRMEAPAPVASVSITKNKPLESVDVSSVTSKGSGSLRPVKKRLGSVDFTLASDEEQFSLVTGDELRPLKKRKASVDFTPGSDEGLVISPLRTDEARPFKKRKGSVDFSLAHDENMTTTDDSKILPLMDALPSMETLPASEGSGSFQIKGSQSVGSSHTQGLAISALDHLDALGEEAGAAAAKVKSEDKTRPRTDSVSSHGTFTSSGGRMLLEAFMSLPGQDHSHGHNLARRDRLESWGGMSDLSVTGLQDNSNSSLVSGCTATAAALAASALEYTSLANDITAVADGMSVSSFLVAEGESKPSPVPTKISLNRMRLDSVASAATEPSAAVLQAGSDGDLSSDLQAFVTAAVASVGDQLAELATAVETAAEVGVTDAITKAIDVPSDMSSAASPMIGATSDNCSRTGSLEGRTRSLSVSSALNISVDYDAVAAAVDAAEAATGAIDLSALSVAAAATADTDSASLSSRDKQRQQLPTHDTSLPIDPNAPPTSKSKADDRDMEIIRERARAAAGYVPPSSPPDPSSRPMPAKKRVKRSTPEPQTPDQRPADSSATPRISNATTKAVPATPYLSSRSTPASSVKATPSKGQSSQKWDTMFDCLVEFIADRRAEDIKGLTEKEIEMWTWDGNVPTTFKTKDGKALGRWVNNQRSAKSKGVLKEDREERLVNAGLKWSVLASNSWNEMLEELRIYVNEQTKEGRKWDGNVPTNYRIKPKAGGKMSDEDKNLGRWVNRQRSLYQSGKLRKDRQLALEKVGLKWSMLATTSWESMYDTLCEYVDAKTKADGEWDGNVPANYRTSDNPPRALGRWINRQRSAYVKDKLKAEYVQKLNSIGLKWSVHERRPVNVDPITSNANNEVNKASESKGGASRTVDQRSAPSAALVTSSAVKVNSKNTLGTNQTAKESKPSPVQSNAMKSTTVIKVEPGRSSATAETSRANESPGAVDRAVTAKTQVSAANPTSTSAKASSETISSAHPMVTAVKDAKPSPVPSDSVNSVTVVKVVAGSSSATSAVPPKTQASSGVRTSSSAKASSGTICSSHPAVQVKAAKLSPVQSNSTNPVTVVKTETGASSATSAVVTKTQVSAGVQTSSSAKTSSLTTSSSHPTVQVKVAKPSPAQKDSANPVAVVKVQAGASGATSAVATKSQVSTDVRTITSATASGGTISSPHQTVQVKAAKPSPSRNNSANPVTVVKVETGASSATSAVAAKTQVSAGVRASSSAKASSETISNSYPTVQVKAAKPSPIQSNSTNPVTVLEAETGANSAACAVVTKTQVPADVRTISSAKASSGATSGAHHIVLAAHEAKTNLVKHNSANPVAVVKVQAGASGTTSAVATNSQVSTDIHTITSSKASGGSISSPHQTVQVKAEKPNPAQNKSVKPVSGLKLETDASGATSAVATKTQVSAGVRTSAEQEKRESKPNASRKPDVAVARDSVATSDTSIAKGEVDQDVKGKSLVAVVPVANSDAQPNPKPLIGSSDKAAPAAMIDIKNELEDKGPNINAKAISKADTKADSKVTDTKVDTKTDVKVSNDVVSKVDTKKDTKVNNDVVSKVGSSANP